MALKTIVMCALICAAVDANYVWPDNSFVFNNPPFPKINFPKIEFPKIKTPEEIFEENRNNPNAVYNGVIVSSSSKSSVGPDGKVIKTGGTRVISDNNGERHELAFGDNPPVIKSASSTPSKDEKNKYTQTVNTVPEIVVPQITLPQITLPQVPVWQPFDPLSSVMSTVNANLNAVSQAVAANNNGAGSYQVISNSIPGGYQSVFSSSNGVGGIASSSSSAFSSSASSINGVNTGGGIVSTSYNLNGDSGGNTVIFSTK